MQPLTLVDLTHPMNHTAPTWDGDCGFFLKTVKDFESSQTVQFCVQEFSLKAGLGTHMDAPRHCFKDQKAIDDFDLNDLLAPLVLFDISLKAQNDPSAQLLSQDVLNYEAKYGLLPKGAIALVSSGWDQRWIDAVSYRNSMIFPTISGDAAALLLERQCIGIGIDTLSPDLPESGYPVHQAVLSKGGFILENVANLGRMPRFGGWVLVSPLKIEGATESPIRLIGLITKEISACTP